MRYSVLAVSFLAVAFALPTAEPGNLAQVEAREPKKAAAAGSDLGNGFVDVGTSIPAGGLQPGQCSISADGKSKTCQGDPPTADKREAKKAAAGSDLGNGFVDVGTSIPAGGLQPGQCSISADGKSKTCQGDPPTADKRDPKKAAASADLGNDFVDVGTSIPAGGLQPGQCSVSADGKSKTCQGAPPTAD